MDRDAAVSYVHKLLATMLEKGGSDLYITAEAAPSIKLDSELVALTNQPLNESNARMLVRSIMNDRQLKQFEEDMESNFAISLPGKARFRVNTFTQRGCAGMVLRHIPNHIPDLKTLNLPPVLRDIAMTKRGLVVMVGATGSGKSTTLASMVDYRNENSKGHIVTIEDPIEFVHAHKGCLITQREVGVDTASYEIAMKNTLRQAPDVILLGEIRDREFDAAARIGALPQIAQARGLPGARRGLPAGRIGECGTAKQAPHASGDWASGRHHRAAGSGGVRGRALPRPDRPDDDALDAAHQRNAPADGRGIAGNDAG